MPAPDTPRLGTCTPVGHKPPICGTLQPVPGASRAVRLDEAWNRYFAAAPGSAEAQRAMSVVRRLMGGAA